ncbi:hypothetical protein LCGC14_1095090 [marine sediment metagenome]|uniref:Uncharacterized protein n=1 Tax=marine sediment metagenome TaxID=412755 RepID=A0A0F9PUB2_9ZZZZ
MSDYQPPKPELKPAKVQVTSKLDRAVRAGDAVVEPGKNVLTAEQWAKIVASQPLRLLVHAGKLIPYASSAEAKHEWYANRGKKASKPKSSKTVAADSKL